MSATHRSPGQAAITLPARVFCCPCRWWHRTKILGLPYGGKLTVGAAGSGSSGGRKPGAPIVAGWILEPPCRMVGAMEQEHLGCVSF